jgi:hypothetical protein
MEVLAILLPLSMPSLAHLNPQSVLPFVLDMKILSW